MAMAFCKTAVSLLIVATALHVNMDPKRYHKLEIVIRDNATHTRPDGELAMCQNHKTVIVTGAQRPGAKQLAAITGIWMTMVDPNFAGAHFQSEFEQGYYEALKHQRVSQLILEEEPVEWVNQIADVVLASHGNPVDLLTNARLTYGMLDCLVEMQRQHTVYQIAQDCCNGVAFDMDFTVLANEPRQIIRSAGTALGLCPDMLTQDWINYVYSIYLDNRPPEEAELEHTDVEQDDARLDAHNKVFGSGECRSWFERGGRYQDGKDGGVEMTKAKVEVAEKVEEQEMEEAHMVKEEEFQDSEERAFGLAGPYP